MARLTTQAGGVSIGRGVAAVVGLITVMILSRLLTPEDYGTYRQLWLIYFLLSPIMQLGLTQSASYYAAQLPRPDRKTYVAQNGLLLVGTGILSTALLLSFTGPIARFFGNAEMVVPLRAFAIFMTFAMPFDLTENTLVALGRAGKAGLVTAVSNALQSAVTLAAFLTGASITRVFLYLSIFAFLRWVLSAAIVLRVYRDLRVRWNWKELKEQIVFSLPMGAAVMVGLLSRQMDKLIVSNHFSPERFAVYANGSYDIPLINIVTLSVTAVLIPAIVRARAVGRVDEVRRVWHGAARRVATMFYPVFIFLLITARPFMVLLFSEEYAASAAPFRVFLFLFPIRIAFHGGFQRALGHSRQIFIASAGAFAISLGLALVLVRVESIGILGPAIASVVAAYFAAGYAVFDCSHDLGWRWTEYFPWVTLGKIMGVALLAALPALGAGWLLRDAGLLARFLVMGVVYAGGYLALGELTGMARPREWLEVAHDVLRQR